MNKAIKCLLAIGLVLFFAASFAAEAKAETPAPMIIAPNQQTATADLTPLITGLTTSGSSVKIYIDNFFDGQTNVLNHESGTANFAYRPSINLSRGAHQIYAVAEDGAGNLSAKTEVLNFSIELPMPAPTLFKPVVNASSSPARPFIVGLAKNDSKIKVYIDKKYSGEFTVNNHDSGTANFAYRPTVALARGEHSVQTIAIDQRGKTSMMSNEIIFKTKSAAIAQAAEEQKPSAVAKIDQSKPAVIAEELAPSISKSTGEIEKVNQVENKNQVLGEKTAAEKLDAQTSGELEEIKSLIATDTAAQVKTGGMIDEGRTSQGKLKLSMAIFVLFLVGVVGWLLWVNRELIKERQAQNELEEKNKQDKLL